MNDHMLVIRIVKLSKEQQIGVRLRTNEECDGLWGQSEHDGPPVIVKSLVADGPAAIAGLCVGDEITAINGKANLSNRSAASELRNADGAIVLIICRRDDTEHACSGIPRDPKSSKKVERQTLEFNKAWAQTSLGVDITHKEARIRIQTLKSDGLVHRAGGKPGDAIISINGEAVSSVFQAASILKCVVGSVRLDIIRVVGRQTEEPTTPKTPSFPPKYAEVTCDNKDVWSMEVLGGLRHRTSEEKSTSGSLYSYRSSTRSTKTFRGRRSVGQRHNRRSYKSKSATHTLSSGDSLRDEAQYSRHSLVERVEVY